MVVSYEGDHVIILSVDKKQESHEMIMWDKVIMSKEDSVFDDTISNMYVLFNDDKSILYFFWF